MQFGPYLARLLQRIWESDPKEVPVWIYKWDISDAFHCCNLRTSDVEKFTYVVTPVPSGTSCLLCIDLVIPMGWFNLTDFFCSASDIVADNANAYALEPTSHFAIYLPTYKVYHTTAAPSASPNRLH